MLLIAVMAVFGPLLAPYDPNQLYVGPVLSPPSLEHHMGTDDLGRDIFSRVLVGAAPSVFAPVFVVILSTALGAAIGISSAWFGGVVDGISSRVIEVIFAIPGLVLAVLAVVDVRQGTDRTRSSALSIAYIPIVSRLVRTAARAELGKPYIAALRIQGVSSLAICFRHLVPAVLPPILAQSTVGFGYAMLDLAAISFLGLGAAAAVVRLGRHDLRRAARAAHGRARAVGVPGARWSSSRCSPSTSSAPASRPGPREATDDRASSSSSTTCRSPRPAPMGPLQRWSRTARCRCGRARRSDSSASQARARPCRCAPSPDCCPTSFTVGGTIRIDGEDISTVAGASACATSARAASAWSSRRPRAHLNPLRTIGDFMTEALVTVAGEKPDAAKRRAIELLAEVGIPDPDRRMRQRPGDLSGGLLQRVMIAATLAMDPPILLADEITTALDVTTQEEVMAVIADLRRHRDLAMLFITHDLALAGAVCDRVAVMQHGRTVETLRAATMRQDAVEPYTSRLLSATLPADVRADSGPPAEPVLVVDGLRKTFQVRSPRGGREEFVAVDGVGFTLAPGGSLGIVGESGSGKSTTARIICGLEAADAGTVTVKGEDWTTAGPRHRRPASTRAHRADGVPGSVPVPRSPSDRAGVPASKRSPCTGRRHRAASWTRESTNCSPHVRLDPGLADRKPRSLSGGQRQRVAIARALAADPEILVLDEAVSALDVTTQVEILTLLDSIRRTTGVALLMISHDLTVVRRLCDHVVVMRAGVIVEQGTIAEVLDDPRADYTRMLLDSIPHDGWVPRRRIPARTTALPTVATTTTRISPPGGPT